jgi:hypothetical protein
MVRRPATTHASVTPVSEGTRAVISDDWTKTEAPMMMPTTIAVA